MQHIIQEGIIYHTKRKLLLTKARRWEQLLCSSTESKTHKRQYPSCHESSDNLCGRHAWNYSDTMSSWKIIKKRNRCYVSDLPEVWQKKKLSRTVCDVQNWCGKKQNLKESCSLEKKTRKTANLNIKRKDTQNSLYDLQEKRGVELEKEEDGEHSAQTELTQSMCLQSEQLLTAIVFSQAIISQETF